MKSTPLNRLAGATLLATLFGGAIGESEWEHSNWRIAGCAAVFGLLVACFMVLKFRHEIRRERRRHVSSVPYSEVVSMREFQERRSA